MAATELGATELADLLAAVALDPALGGRERVLDLGVADGFVTHDAHGRPDGDHAHVLHAAGDDHVLHARHDAHGSEADVLLARSALAVDGDAGDGFGKPGNERCGAGDVAGLGTHVVEATHDDVVDGHRVDAGALDQALDGVRADVGGVLLGEAPSPAPDRRPYGVDDVGLTHVHAPLRAGIANPPIVPWSVTYRPRRIGSPRTLAQRRRRQCRPVLRSGRSLYACTRHHRLLHGDLPRRARTLVEEWTVLRREELMADWARAERQEPLQRIEPLP